jgi:hypothetical protein
MNKRLVHEYLLPKAQDGKVLIFSWRQSGFWDLAKFKCDNILVRNANKAINNHFLEDELYKIHKLLEQGL